MTYRTPHPQEPDAPRSGQTMRPLPLVLSGTAGGAVAALVGAFAEHLAAWTHGSTIGAVAGCVAFGATVVAARARHAAANPPPPPPPPAPLPPPPRPREAGDVVLDNLMQSVRDARAAYNSARLLGPGSLETHGARETLKDAEDRFAAEVARRNGKRGAA